MKSSVSLLLSAQKLLLAYNAHTSSTINRATNVLSLFKKKKLELSFKKHRQDKIDQSERLLTRFKKEKLNRFDIFKKAGFVAHENNLSDAIAALLDPNGSHKLGLIPISSLLINLQNQIPTKIASFITLLEKNKSQLTVHRERHEEETIPDIEIVCSDFIIFIENKIRGGLETFRNGIWQTERQWKALCNRCRSLGISEKCILAIYLTPEGIPAKNSHFIPLRVSELVSALKDAVKNSDSLTKYSILTFLDHYVWK